MSSVIAVENLSKKYIIGHQKQKRHATLREALANGSKDIAEKLRHPWRKQQANPSLEEFWALKDVSFDVQPGDRVGIIGRNGAGKSTLLKILSRITEPTSGKALIRGRVASLLEVGTGFHPELTGRENIFLNGAVLGMSKAEIKQKFDEIVDFAEVEKFLDTPVKRYSSGMYVRLAFAVAAHLEPELLIVDEVLAVGDLNFQRKCLGKMKDVGQEGRTVLFVSHNMVSIQQICTSGIMLRDGAVCASGPIEKVIEFYLGDSLLTGEASIGGLPREKPEYGVIAKFLDAWPVNSKSERVEVFMSAEELSFDLQIKASETIDNLSIVTGLDTYMDYRIATVLSHEVGALFSAREDDKLLINLKFPQLRLKPGRYSLTLGIRRGTVTLDHVVRAVHFEVSDVSRNVGRHEAHIRGDILVESIWSQKH